MHRLGRVSVGTRIAVLSLAALVEATPARAHHGKDFLLVETYEIPHPRQVYLISSQDLVREEGLDHWSASPGVLVGVWHPLAFELHAHVEKAPDEGWRHEAIAPAIRLQLTPEGSSSPFRLGLSAEYELASEEGHDHLEGRLILAYRRDSSNVTLNLIAEREQEGETEWGYAVGARPDVDARLGWGIEALGSLASGGSHEVLAGLYAAPSDRLQLKIGIGKGFGGDASYWSVRTGLVVRLW